MANILSYFAEVGIDFAFSDTPVDRKKDIKNYIPVTKNAISDKKENKVNLNKDSLSLNQSILSKIKATQSVEDLYDLLLSFDGCDLKKTALNTVFFDGVRSAPVMIIGEAPGADEDRLGKPFVGQSGQLVDKMFKTIGLSRSENLYISNIVFWRPPGNRPPTQMEIDTCLPFLERHIALVQPKVLVLLGGVATKTLLKTDLGIVKLRGKAHTFSCEGLKDSIPVMPFYHPAYLLRSPRQKAVFWQDLLSLKKLLSEI
ncbi:MAG: hypothetical protein HEEMFOPI_00009 [Holosporales bacterium]